MNLLQVVPYDSYPPRMGGDHRTHGLVKEFPKKNNRVFRFCQGGSPKLYKSLDFQRRVIIEEGYIEYRHLHPLHELVKAPMLIGYPNLLAGLTLRHASDSLRSHISDADVILVREPWQFKTVNKMAPDTTPIVYSSHNIETERFKDISRPLFDQRTIKLVQRLEQYAVDQADAIVTTSELDSDMYRNKFKSTAPHIVAPNGTYEELIRPHDPNKDDVKKLQKKYHIEPDTIVCLFIGSDYQPNVVAAEYVTKFARSLPSIEFIIIGTVGKSFTSRTIPENVTVTGYVEDRFEAHFDLADIALNPMTTGGGTNIKLIDYFARSLPVVSTPFGARGVDIDIDHNIVISKIESFPEAIEALASDNKRRESIGDAARLRASRQYTWEKSSRYLQSKLIEKLDVN